MLYSKKVLSCLKKSCYLCNMGKMLSADCGSYDTFATWSTFCQVAEEALFHGLRDRNLPLVLQKTCSRLHDRNVSSFYDVYYVIWVPPSLSTWQKCSLCVTTEMFSLCYQRDVISASRHKCYILVAKVTLQFAHGRHITSMLL